MPAFCIICGISLSYKKLHRADQHWIGPSRLDHHLPIKIYEYGWVPRDIAIKVDGATEILGGLHDPLHTGVPQAEAAEDFARLHRTVLDGAYASGTSLPQCSPPPQRFCTNTTSTPYLSSALWRLIKSFTPCCFALHST